MLLEHYKDIFFSKKKNYGRIISNLLCIINSSKNKNLASLSIKKYSDTSFRFKKNKFLNLFVSFIFFLLIGCFMLFKSLINYAQRKNKKVDIVVNSRNSKIHDQFFSKLTKKISKYNFKIQGENFDYPSIENNFNITSSLRIILLMFKYLPLVIIISIISRTNYFQSLVRSILIYNRTFHHFNSFPTIIYLTFEDNACSPMFYDAFKNSGGYKLLAYQNGLRFREKSLFGNCFDHLFCYGESSLKLYRNLNAKIINYNFVPSIILSNNISLLKKKKEIIDILFIDEGLPFSANKKYTYNFVKEDYLKKYINDIIKFSKSNHNLNLVFQLRPYDKFQEEIFTYAKSIFSNSKIKINKCIDSYETYRKIQLSKIIVTNQSTIGIEALSMGKTAIFSNHSGKNRILGNHPFQLNYKGYKSFEQIITKFMKKKNNKLINQTSFFVTPAKNVNTNDILFKKINEYLKINNNK